MTHSETVDDISSGAARSHTEFLLKKYLEQVSKQRDRLEKRFGSGVRPSYVSADLGILDERIERYTAAIKKLTDE